ncbi:MAG: GNAT family N-acetyltransferase [Williamsia sp.]|nr:GNAT family N-acetyltransferase [Williamsia sp.]
MELIPIQPEPENNPEFASNPLCQESLPMTIDFYKRVGFQPPWICYYARLDDQLVGSVAFKGRPVNGTVEIAYGTFEPYQNRGIGAQLCRKLVELSLATDPSVRITARTLPENNFSARLLRRNGFRLLGTVQDPEDGSVWEWEYKKD